MSIIKKNVKKRDNKMLSQEKVAHFGVSRGGSSGLSSKSPEPLDITSRGYFKETSDYEELKIPSQQSSSDFDETEARRSQISSKGTKVTVNTDISPDRSYLTSEGFMKLSIETSDHEKLHIVESLSEMMITVDPEEDEYEEIEEEIEVEEEVSEEEEVEEVEEEVLSRESGDHEGKSRISGQLSVPEVSQRRELKAVSVSEEEEEEGEEDVYEEEIGEVSEKTSVVEERVEEDLLTVDESSISSRVSEEEEPQEVSKSKEEFVATVELSPPKQKCRKKIIVKKIVKTLVKKNKDKQLLPPGDKRVSIAADIPAAQVIFDKKDQERLLGILKGKLLELGQARRKHKFLIKSLIGYFKHKQMDSAYAEESESEDTASKYSKRLKLYEEMRHMATNEKQRKEAELTELKDEFEELKKEYAEKLKNCLQREQEMGRNLIDSQTGKPFDGTIVSQMGNRHRVLAKRLSMSRLKLIKLQNYLNTQEAFLKSIDKLDGNLTLMEYEQLKMDNQNFADKLEEREEELASFRSRIQDSIHTFAHIREKFDAVVNNTEVYNERLTSAELQVALQRENVNTLKHRRDVLRDETTTLKKEAGLLVRPRLLLDLKNSSQKLDQGKAKLNKLIEKFNDNKEVIKRLRKRIEEFTEDESF